MKRDSYLTSRLARHLNRIQNEKDPAKALDHANNILPMLARSSMGLLETMILSFIPPEEIMGSAQYPGIIRKHYQEFLKANPEFEMEYDNGILDILFRDNHRIILRMPLRQGKVFRFLCRDADNTWIRWDYSLDRYQMTPLPKYQGHENLHPISEAAMRYHDS